MEYDIKIVSSLEKTLPVGGESTLPELTRLSAFRGEKVSFQVIYCYHGSFQPDFSLTPFYRNPYATVTVEHETGAETRIREVGLVPVYYPHPAAYNGMKEEYYADHLGIYPDYLTDYTGGIQIRTEQWRSLWIDMDIPMDARAGDYEVKVVVRERTAGVVASPVLKLHVIPAVLPPQKLIHTEWFHTDCIADYYGLEVFSEEHWRITENFMKTAVNNGINMILVPIFTPPLDTAVGGERTTVQLVKVKKENSSYSFDFSLFERFIETARRAGYEYFEMSHLFSQWGAKFPPKVICETDGKSEKIFGWQKTVKESGYAEFLEEFLPALVKELEKLGIKEKTYLHISDEPSPLDIDSYIEAKELVKKHVGDVKTIDALSDVRFYKSGAVEKPVPGLEAVHSFLDENVPDCWCYFCCSEAVGAANRFIAMPAYKNRILGVQLYKFRMEGLLQWGYNFYNSAGSVTHINPYMVNDAGEAFPAGDPFVVYPGKNGECLESMRLPVTRQAIDDMRALSLLESLAGRDYTVSLIDEIAGMDLRFTAFPKSADFILTLRERVSEEIEKRLG